MPIPSKTFTFLRHRLIFNNMLILLYQNWLKYLGNNLLIESKFLNIQLFIYCLWYFCWDFRAKTTFVKHVYVASIWFGAILSHSCQMKNSGPLNLKKWITFYYLKTTKKNWEVPIFFTPSSFFHSLPLRGLLHPKEGERDLF